MYVALNNGTGFSVTKGEEDRHYEIGNEDNRDKDWYKKVVASKKLEVGEVHASSDNNAYKGKKISAIAYPIIQNGKFIGVVAANVLVEGLSKVLQGVTTFNELEKKMNLNF